MLCNDRVEALQITQRGRRHFGTSAGFSGTGDLRVSRGERWHRLDHSQRNATGEVVTRRELVGEGAAAPG